MKISESIVQLASNHGAETMDLSIKDESRQTITRQRENPVRSLTLGDNPLSAIWMDRVSIAQNQTGEYQSQYTGTLASHSNVLSSDGQTFQTFEQKELVENLVGAVIDRRVTAVTLRNGDDIRSQSSVDTGSEAEPRVPSLSTSRETLASMKQIDIHFEQEQMGFSSTGEVRTQDGRVIDFSLDVTMDRALLSRVEQETMVHTWQEQVNLIDPLVISLDGSLPQLTDTRFQFDLNNDGQTEEISFVSKGSGFLAFDKNNDHKINNGSELFGPGTGNGFEELAAFDSDSNGWIDENDEVFAQLSVWTRDDTGNDVLVSLKEAGLGAIYLDNAQTGFDLTGPDNQLKGRLNRSGVFLFENGNVGTIQQIDLAAQSSEPAIEQNRTLFSGVPLGRIAFPGEAEANTNNLDVQKSENPWIKLMDEINELREKTRQLIEKKSGREKFQNLEFKDTSLSDYQLYMMTDPSSLFWGNREGRGWEA